MAKMLRSKLFGYINNLDQDMQHSRVLKKDRYLYHVAGA